MSGLKDTGVAVIGASSGIGRHLATVLWARSARVVAAARRRELLESLGEEREGIHAVVTDVTDPASARALGAAVDEHLGPLDAVVYCAGTGAMAAIASTPAEQWQRDYDVNVVGANLVVANLLPRLRPDGVVMFLSSRSAGNDEYWGLASYAASKASLDKCIRHWRVEHPAARFLRVVMGNVVGTGFADDFDPDVTMTALEQWSKRGIDLNTMDVDDVADALASVLELALDHPAIDVRELQFEARRS